MTLPTPSPKQLQWIVDHNQQIRGSHRVQICNAADAWRAERAQRDELLQLVRQVMQFVAADPYPETTAYPIGRAEWIDNARAAVAKANGR